MQAHKHPGWWKKGCSFRPVKQKGVPTYIIVGSLWEWVQDGPRGTSGRQRPVWEEKNRSPTPVSKAYQPGQVIHPAAQWHSNGTETSPAKLGGFRMVRKAPSREPERGVSSRPHLPRRWAQPPFRSLGCTSVGVAVCWLTSPLRGFFLIPPTLQIQELYWQFQAQPHNLLPWGLFAGLLG